MPEWLTILAIGSLVLAGVCASVIVIDIMRGHRQHLWVMNLVWPITALYSGPLALWAYFAIGRLSTHEAIEEARDKGRGRRRGPNPSGSRSFGDDPLRQRMHPR